jgi:hypothetical protein
MNITEKPVERQRSIYRVDSFTVPVAARDEFLDRLVVIRDFLQSQSGCLFNRIAETAAENGVVRMMTIVEWRDQGAVQNARANAAAYYERTGFNPQELMDKLGITPDFGLFRDTAV